MNDDKSVVVYMEHKPPIVKIEDQILRYLIVRGVKIPVSFRAYELFEEMSEYDYDYTLFIDDIALRDALINAGLVTRSSRGSICPTELFNELHEEIMDKTAYALDVNSVTEWTPTEANINVLPEPIRQYIFELRSSL